MIAGGGTGGHVVPAIAIGQALVERGHPPDTIHFLGSSRGLERTMVPDAGFDVTLLPGRGIARRLTIDNIGAVAGLLAATGQAVALLGRMRPAVVIAVGGYASVAGAVAAVVWRVPLVVAEQNAVPGLANRLAGRFAAACAVSFPGTPLPRAVVTGNPVRRQILSVDRGQAGRTAARIALGLPADRFVVGVSGGSLGARRINEAVLGLAAMWADRADVAIRHVVGHRDFDTCAAGTAGAGAGRAHLPAGSLRRSHGPAALGRRCRGAAGRRQHRRRADRGRPARHPGAPPGRARRPPDRQRGAAGGRRRRRGDPGRRARRRPPGGRARPPHRRTRPARQRMGAAARALARPEAAAAVAALAEDHARG